MQANRKMHLKYMDKASGSMVWHIPKQNKSKLFSLFKDGIEVSYIDKEDFDKKPIIEMTEILEMLNNKAKKTFNDEDFGE